MGNNDLGKGGQEILSGVWQSPLSTDPNIATNFGGYWAWFPDPIGSPQGKDNGSWVWLTNPNASPADLDSQHKPFSGDPAPFLNPTTNPDGTVVGTKNWWYTGQFWPDGSKNKNYVPDDTAVPGLDFTDGAAPHITGNPVGGGTPGTGDAALPSDMYSFRVAPGSLRGGELAADLAAADAVMAYDKVTAQLDASKSSLGFYAPSSGYPDLGIGSSSAPWMDQQLKNASDILAKNVADSLRLVGEYAATLNNAGQWYAKADHDSFIAE